MKYSRGSIWKKSIQTFANDSDAFCTYTSGEQLVQYSVFIWFCHLFSLTFIQQCCVVKNHKGQWHRSFNMRQATSCCCGKKLATQLATELQKEWDMVGKQLKRVVEEGERNRKQKSEAEEARAHEDSVDRNVTNMVSSQYNRHRYFTVCSPFFFFYSYFSFYMALTVLCQDIKFQQ